MEDTGDPKHPRQHRTVWVVQTEDLAGQRLELIVALVELEGRFDLTLRVGSEGRTALLLRKVEIEQDVALDVSAALRAAIYERMWIDGEL